MGPGEMDVAEVKNELFTHRQLAGKCFNHVWDLLDKKERTKQEEEQMVHLCHASFWHWTQVEDHTQQNLSIGYWQLSRVYSEIGNGEQALHYAHHCIAVSLEAKLAPFYIGYAYEALARAQMTVDQVEQALKSIETADTYTSLVTILDSKQLLTTDLENMKEKISRTVL
jgi:tetratricopeptide (TPR) repeat protein